MLCYGKWCQRKECRQRSELAWLERRGHEVWRKSLSQLGCFTTYTTKITLEIPIGLVRPHRLESRRTRTLYGVSPMNGAQAPTTKPTVVHRTQRKDEILLLHTTESVAYKRAHHHQGPERWSGAVGPANRSIYVTWSRLISGRNIIILSISGCGLGCGFP